MLVPLLVASVALQIERVPLVDPGGDDDRIGSSAVLALPGTGKYLVPHLYGSTTRVDLAGGPTLSAGGGPESPRDAVVVPGGATALVVDSWLDRLWFFDAATGAIQGDLGLPLDLASAIDLDGAGTRAIVSETCAGSHDFVVVDLATRSIERTVQPGGTYYGCDSGHVFAHDDVTAVRARRRAIVGFDVRTGAVVGSTPFSTSDSEAFETLVREDRRVAYVVCQRGRGGPAPSLWLESFDLPSLAPRSVIPLARGLLGGPSPTMDDAGTRLTFRADDSVYVADLTTGIVRRLVETQYPEWWPLVARVSRDGQRVLVSEDDHSRTFDAVTGTELGAVPFGGAWELAACPRASFGSTFVMAGRDRLVVIDAAPSPPRIVADVSSGAGGEIDGPFRPAVLGDGRQAVFIARDSDALHVVDLRARALGARVPLARAPVDLAVDDAGDVLVAHREGRRISIVDRATWTVRSEIPLAVAARQIEAVPGTTTAWALLENDSARALVQIDTSGAGAVVGTIPLGGSSNLPANFDSVRFDFERDRAYVIEPAVGRIRLVDLAARVVEDTDFFRPGRLARMSVPPTGNRVVVVSSDNEVKAFDVSNIGLTYAWAHSCTPSTPGAESAATLVELDGGEVVHIGDYAPGVCLGPRLIRVSTGNQIAWTAYPSRPNAGTLVDGNEVIEVDSSVFAQRRWDGQSLERTRSIFASSVSIQGGLQRDPIGLQTFGIDVSSFWPHDLVFLDFASVTSTIACSPTVPNSLGVDAQLAFDGGALAGSPLVVTTSGLRPGAMLSMLLVADSSAPPRLVPGGIGSICLGGEVGRFVQQIQVADPDGRARTRVETVSLPLGSGAASVAQGESWTFQTWYRDVDSTGSIASHFSDAVTVSFE